jgi:Holliday junction resolvasome RuvABC endonuclease subunit
MLSKQQRNLPLECEEDPVAFRVLGVDPAFRKYGWCIVAILWDGSLLYEEFGLIETAKADKKAKLLVSSDNINRATKITNELAEVYERYSGIVAICAEAPAGSKNAKSASALGIAQGLTAAFAADRNLPIFSETPQGLKKKLCGTKSASKARVRDKLLEVAVFTDKAKASIAAVKAKSKHEHMYDAGAAVWVLRDCAPMLLLRNMHGL